MERPAAAIFSHDPTCPPVGNGIRMSLRLQAVGGAAMDLWVIGVVLALGAATFGLYWLVDSLRPGP